MITPLNINVWITFVICALNHILGVSSIEIGATLPPKVEDALKNTKVSEVLNHLNKSRRILDGSPATSNRPYMVYLKLPFNNAKYSEYRNWLCGGVIIHEEYILTSAACIEDVKHFYVVSGTYKHSDRDDLHTNMCIKNGARKAIWKCIPRNYVFDGHENDNIRWMNNDIAVVKVDEEFDFTRRVRGCDFIPKPICYNNQSDKYEQAGTECSIAGWGSTDKYRDVLTVVIVINNVTENYEQAGTECSIAGWCSTNKCNSVNTRRQEVGQDLLEAGAVVIAKARCKQRWGHRYDNIIDNYMVCTMDITQDLSEICSEKYVDCKDIMYSSSEETSRRVLDPQQLSLHSAYHNESEHAMQFRRHSKSQHGGFCENDHGGPLVYGTGASSIVIGIISACLVRERTNACYGPFLYTSVYKNKKLISCAIYKEASECNKMFRSGSTHIEEDMSWTDHPDGPSKTEIKKMRRNEELKNFTKSTVENSTESVIATAGSFANTSVSPSIQFHTKLNEGSLPHVKDTPLQQDGLIIRNDDDKIKSPESIVNKTMT